MHWISKRICSNGNQRQILIKGTKSMKSPKSQFDEQICQEFCATFSAIELCTSLMDFGAALQMFHHISQNNFSSAWTLGTGHDSLNGHYKYFFKCWACCAFLFLCIHLKWGKKLRKWKTQNEEKRMTEKKKNQNQNKKERSFWICEIFYIVINLKFILHFMCEHNHSY